MYNYIFIYNFVFYLAEMVKYSKSWNHFGWYSLKDNSKNTNTGHFFLTPLSALLSIDKKSILSSESKKPSTIPNALGRDRDILYLLINRYKMQYGCKQTHLDVIYGCTDL